MKSAQAVTFAETFLSTLEELLRSMRGAADDW